MGKIMGKFKSSSKVIGSICLLLTSTFMLGGCTESKQIFQEEISEIEQSIDSTLVQAKQEENFETELLSNQSTAGRKVDSYAEEFENIKEIELHSYSSQVSIKKGSQFRVEAQNLPEEYLIKETDGQLILGKRENSNRNSVFDSSYLAKKTKSTIITIYLPEEYQLDLAYLDVSGITIEELYATKLVLDSGSKSSFITNVTAKQSSIDSGSGSINIENSSLGKTNIDSGSGRVKFTNVAITDCDLDSGSGEVMIAGQITGDIDIDSGSAPVIIKSETQLGNLDLDTGSGDVTINAPGERSNYQVYSDGMFYLNGEKYNHTDDKNKNSRYDLRVDSGSGKISIRFDETNIINSVSKTSSTSTVKLESKSVPKEKDYTKDITLSYPKVGKNCLTYLDIKDNLLIKKEDISLNDITKITVNVSLNDIHVYTTDSEDLTVFQTYFNGKSTKKPWNLKEKEIFDYQKKGKNIAVNIDDSKYNETYGRYTTLYLFVPSSYKNNLEIVTSLGDVFLEHPIQLDTMQIVTSLGDIFIKNNMIAQKINIVTSLGDVKFEKEVSVDTFEIATSLGDCRIKDNFYCNNLLMNLNMGDFKLEKEINCRKAEIHASEVPNEKIHAEYNKIVIN